MCVFAERFPLHCFVRLFTRVTSRGGKRPSVRNKNTKRGRERKKKWRGKKRVLAEAEAGAGRVSLPVQTQWKASSPS